MSGLNEGMDSFLNAYIKMKQLKQNDDQIAMQNQNRELDSQLKQMQVQNAERDRQEKEDQRGFDRAGKLSEHYAKMAESGNIPQIGEDTKSLLSKYGYASEYKPQVNSEKEQKRKLLELQLSDAERKSKGLGGDISELRKEFMSNPVTKDTQNVATSYQKIQSAAQNPSAAGDLSLIFGYMKMLDPGSTVREGEFANAQNAAGVSDQVRNAYNRAMTGERLNPNQRKDFIGQAKNIYAAQKQRQNAINKQYQSLASEYGYEPKLVVNPSIFDVGDMQAAQDAKYQRYLELKRKAGQ